MHYYIDGYNMLFRLAHSEGKLQSQREKIIFDLNQKISLLQLDVSVVFDATFQLGDRTRTHYDHLEILFTNHGETADEYILEEIQNSKTPRQETVVTSDKKLASLARRKSAHTESIDVFLEWLDRVYKNRLKRLSDAKKIPPKLSTNPASPVGAENTPIEKKQPMPSLKAKAEECTDYYEQIFETKFQEILKEEKPKRKASQPTSETSEKKKKKKPVFEKQNQTPEEKALDDMDRWLKIFEHKIKTP